MRRARTIFLLTLVLLYGRTAYEYGFQLAGETHFDLPTFYWTAQAVFESGVSPYEPAAFVDAERALGQRVYPYLYAPQSILLLYPFTWVTYPQAALVTLFINHLMLLVFVYLLFRKILPGNLLDDHPLEACFLLTYVLVFFPILLTIDHGQSNLLVLNAICLFWFALREKRSPALVAAALVIAALMKTYPLVLVGLLIIKKQYRSVAWCFAFGSVATLLALIVLPKSLWGGYLDTVTHVGGYARDVGTYFSAADPWNQSINGFTSRLFLGTDLLAAIVPNITAARVAPYFLSGVVIILTTVMCWRVSQKHGNRFIDLEVSAFLLLMFLIAPYSWEHHHVLMLPAVVIAWRLLVFSDASSLRVRSLVAIGAIIIAWRVHHAWLGWQTGLLRFGMSAKFYAVAMIWFIVVRALHERIASATEVASRTDE